MFKLLSLISICVLTTLSALAGPIKETTYRCSYSVTESDNDDTEYVTLDIVLNENHSELFYQSTELNDLIVAPIASIKSDYMKITLEGFLPAPWDKGSAFKIVLDDENWYYSLQITPAAMAPLKPILMSCENI